MHPMVEASQRRSTVPLLVLLGACGCAIAPITAALDPGRAGPEAGPKVSEGSPWMATVAGRIRNDARAFVADGDAFVVRSPEQGLKARFDAGGAHLGRAGESDAMLPVQSLAWGRAGALDDVAGRSPALGDCVPGAQDPSGTCIRSLEYRGVGFTESWHSTAEGFEQGWTLDVRPDGSGPIGIDVGVEGATVTVGEDEVWILGASGEPWTVSGLEAWDADGVPLRARFELSTGGFRVSVDDLGARYPVTIDPVYSTAAWVAYGSDDDGNFGYSVAGVGDVNGDGYDDVMVGATEFRSYTGRAYLYEGSPTGLSTVASVMLAGTSSGDHFGICAGAGDVNHDGYDDVIAGAYYLGSGDGRAYVYLGSPTGIPTTPSTTLLAVTTSGDFGSSVSGAGDVNGDGYDDVIVGSTDGAAYLYSGSADGVVASVASTLTGESGAGTFGSRVSGAGDVDGDGYADVIVGAYTWSGSTGRAYIYRGSATGISDTAATTLTGEATSDDFGAAVSGAGDVNGDGYDDVIVGAEKNSSVHGRAYVYQGSASGLSSTPSTTLSGDTSAYYFGCAVAGAGDVDGDGYDDVIVGADAASGYAGEVYVFAGAATGVSDAAMTTMVGTRTGRLGGAVSGAGDVDGDGFADVLAGATTGGAAYVWAGSSTGVATAATTTLIGATGSDELGCAVSDAGDVNADGYDDVIIGAYAYGSNAGRAYVFEGSPSGLSTTAATTLEGYTDSSFGISVSGAGDVNHDGYDDVIVGASQSDAYAGRADLFLGSPAGVVSTPSTTVTGGAAGNYLGSSVSGAGDVNGDGYDDVIVGAAFASSAYVYPGSVVGLSTAALATLTGEAADDRFGWSVSGAGDVNGDGYDDVIVGAYGYSTRTGRAHVYMGSSSGPSETAGTVLAGESTSTAFGLSVSDAGDVNGDGYGDVIVGAYQYSSYTGRTYVYLGSSLGLPTAASTTLTGESDHTYFGGSVSRAGDVDRDGYDDVIVGAYGYDGSTGRAYVYTGSPTGLSGTATTTLDGEGWSDDFGYSVSGAGDLDGDGYDDLLIGAAGYSSGAAYAYSGYVDADLDGYAASVDCDDHDPAVHPGAVEICDGFDDDCNGSVDDNAVDATVWYVDSDGDGYTDSSVSVTECNAPDGYAVATVDDCDDTDSTSHPDAVDIPGDGIDQDCDGTDAPIEDSGDDTGTGDTNRSGKDEGCGGCASAPDESGLGLLVLAGVLVRRRRV